MKILLIPILLIPILLIPTVIITFIYKLLYNHHLNKTLKAKLPNKWLPPFTVGIITFFILNIMIVLTVIMGYKTYHSHSEVTVKSTSSTCAFKEVENSITSFEDNISKPSLEEMEECVNNNYNISNDLNRKYYDLNTVNKELLFDNAYILNLD